MIDRVLSTKNILLDLKAETKLEVINALSENLVQNNNILNAGKFIADVLKRENLHSTFVGSHLAIPHGSSDTVEQPNIVVARTNKVFNWDTDVTPVRLIILFAITEQEQYLEELEILKKVAGALGEDQLVMQMLEAQSEIEIMDLLNNAILNSEE